MMALNLKPCSLKDANAYVTRLHRHSAAVVGHKFSLGAWLDGALVGVAIVGRPISRMLDDGKTLEVTRVCTDGAHNACSFLYGAARRAAFALGYQRVLTYTTERESGSSLKAVGWTDMGIQNGALTWGQSSGIRRGSPLLAWGGIADPRKRPDCRKRRWETTNPRSL
jgi:hypothetical protein